MKLYFLVFERSVVRFHIPPFIIALFSCPLAQNLILLLHIAWNRLYKSCIKINLQNVLSSYVFFLIEELTFLALVCMRYLRQINVLVNLHAFLISYNFVKWFIVIIWSLWYSFELYLTISCHKIRFCVLRWPKLT